jgi:hypothetical protein
VGAANTTVFGFVWNPRDEPIPKAAVRLRNVTTGRAEAHAVTTETGEFTFDDIEGGTYLTEYVNDKGRVLAVGHVFTIAPGETVATFIRLTTGTSWFAALLGAPSNVAATAVASAASLGLTALARPGRDVTPER